MSYRKSSRNKYRHDNDNPKLVRTYKLNKAIASEVHETSIYEIDINGSINFSGEGRDNSSVRVCIANVAPLTLEKKTTGKNGAFRIVQNPLIESHYPRFRETDSESERRLPTIEKADLITQTSLSSDIQDKNAHGPAKGQSFVEKGNVDSQSPSPDSFSRLKTQVKNQLVNNLFTKNESVLPGLANSDKELLHLHHHEHHHHYHFDKKGQRDGDDSFLCSSKPSSCESQEVITTGRKRFPAKRKTFDEDKSKHTYYYTCESKSNATFTKIMLNADTDDLQDSDRPIRIYRTSRASKASRLRPSSSIEFMPNNKSYLLEAHTYSDTELVRCESDKVIRCDVIRSKDFNTNHTSLVSSLKSLSHGVPSALPSTDQKSTPKATSIKSAYPAKKHSGPILTCAVVDATTELHTDNATWDEIPIKKHERTPKKDSDVSPFIIKRSNNGRLDTIPLQTWAEKIKSELKEIKKELRMIEKEFLKRKPSMCTELNESKPKSEEESGQEISVFSSRTFILRAENFYIIEESDSGPFSEDMDSFFGNDEF